MGFQDMVYIERRATVERETAAVLAGLTGAVGTTDLAKMVARRLACEVKDVAPILSKMAGDGHPHAAKGAKTKRMTHGLVTLWEWSREPVRDALVHVPAARVSVPAPDASRGGAGEDQRLRMLGELIAVQRETVRALQDIADALRGRAAAPEPEDPEDEEPAPELKPHAAEVYRLLTCDEETNLDYIGPGHDLAAYIDQAIKNRRIPEAARDHAAFRARVAEELEASGLVRLVRRGAGDLVLYPAAASASDIL